MLPETLPGRAIAGLVDSRGDGETLDVLFTSLKAVEVDSIVMLVMSQSESSLSLFASLNLAGMPRRDPALLLTGVHSDVKVGEPTLSRGLFGWDISSIQVSSRRLIEDILYDHLEAKGGRSKETFSASRSPPTRHVVRLT